MPPLSLNQDLENELPELFKLTRLFSTAGLFASSGSSWKKAFFSSARIAVPIIRPPEGCEKSTAKPHVIEYDPLPTNSSIRLLEIKPLDSPKDEFDMFQPIHCSLITRDLNENPQYDALSYTWGDPRTIYNSAGEVSSPAAWAATCWEIYCDGKLVSISTNLYTALLAIRWLAAHEGLPGFSNERFTGALWIDALCINQQDLTEKSSQLMLMSRIYRQAMRTFIWLGGHDDHIAAVDALMNLGILKRKQPEQEIAALNSVLVVDQEKDDRPSLAKLTKSQCLSILSFFNRSWFSRVWVVQEVAMSRDPVFIYGSRMFPLNAVYDGIGFLFLSGWMEQLKVFADKYIKQLNNQSGSSFKYNPEIGFRENAEDIPHPENLPFPITGRVNDYIDRTDVTGNPAPRFVRWKTGEAFDFRIVQEHWEFRKAIAEKRHYPFFMVAQNLRASEATNPRDKIYALLGLAWDHEKNQSAELSLHPDYECPTRDTFIRAARFAIESVDTLDLLSLKESFSKMKDLPSWVPDFSAKSKPSPWNVGYRMPWKASGKLPTHAYFLPKNQLEVKGNRIGKVKNSSIFPQLSPLTDITDLPSLLWDLPELSEIPLHQVNGGQHLGSSDGVSRYIQQGRLEVFWRTMVLDTDCLRDSPAPPDIKNLVLKYIQQTVTMTIFRAVLSCFDDPVSIWESLLQGQLQEYLSRGTTWEEALNHAAKTYTSAKVMYGDHPYDGDLICPPELEQLQRDLKDETKTEMDKLGVKCLLLNEIINRITLEEFQDNNLKAGPVGRLVSQSSWGRKIFSTDSGHLGTGTEVLESGDEIWVLAGADVPFILRSLGGQTYRLLGEAYVHGVMYGQENDENVGSPSSVSLQKVIIV